MREDDDEAVESDEFDVAVEVVVLGSGPARRVGVWEGRRSGWGRGIGEGDGERRCNVGVGVDVDGV